MTTIRSAKPLNQSGPLILSESFHGECCDECGYQILMDGTCPNCEEKYEIEQQLRQISWNYFGI